MPNPLQTSVRRQGNETARLSGFKGMLELVQGCAGVRWGTICFNLLQSDTPRVLVIQSIVYCALSVVPSLLCIVLNSSDRHWKTPSHFISSPITLSHVFVDSLTHPHSHLHTQTMIRPTPRPSSKHNQTDTGTSTGTEIASPVQPQTSSDLRWFMQIQM